MLLNLSKDIPRKEELHRRIEVLGNSDHYIGTEHPEDVIDKQSALMRHCVRCSKSLCKTTVIPAEWRQPASCQEVTETRLALRMRGREYCSKPSAFAARRA